MTSLKLFVQEQLYIIKKHIKELVSYKQPEQQQRNFKKERKFKKKIANMENSDGRL